MHLRGPRCLPCSRTFARCPSHSARSSSWRAERPPSYLWWPHQGLQPPSQERQWPSPSLPWLPRSPHVPCPSAPPPCRSHLGVLQSPSQERQWPSPSLPWLPRSPHVPCPSAPPP